ncbi:MAG: FeS-binding protein [Planctomycetota bacterium]|nr:MAG: FeS-binding protein [Planctomycetota bacterium]
MNSNLTLTFSLMDPPYENARSTTAFRLIEAALRKGFHVNVFAYEGAVALPFLQQRAHANAVHGRDVEQEEHPLPHQWVQSLMRLAEEKGLQLQWVNCGLCVDERGVDQAVSGVRRGTPGDLWQFAQQSVNTLIIPAS